MGRARWAAASRARRDADGSVMGAAVDGALARESRSGGAPRCRCGSSTCRRNCALRTAKVPVQSRRVNASSHALPPSLPRCCSSACLRRRRCIVYEVFGAYLDSLRDQAGIPGLAAAIVDTNGIVWERAYGRQDIGRALRDPHRHSFQRRWPDADDHRGDGAAVRRRAPPVAGRYASARSASLRQSRTRPIRQLLTHTSGAPDNLTFLLRPERLAPLWPIVRTCAVDSYREIVRESAPPARDVRFGSRARTSSPSCRRPKACRIPKTSSATPRSCSGAQHHMRWTIARARCSPRIRSRPSR